MIQTILGIDPGSRITGYGIIRSDGYKHLYVTSGRLILQSDSLSEKLAQIYTAITDIIREHQPQESAIEQVFMAKNANSALKLGHARGAAIVAMAGAGLSVAEYSARSVKQCLVGYGAAGKEQVQHMVKLLLKLSTAPAVDAADALAVAICHAQSRNHPELHSYKKFSLSKKGSSSLLLR